MIGSCAATSAENVDETFLAIGLHKLGHLLGRLVIMPHGVGKSGIRVCTHAAIGVLAQHLHILLKLFGAKRTIKTNTE